MAALLLLRLALDLRVLWADPLRFVHWEEAWNATAGRVAWATGRPDLLLAMQNKAFCGGCSVVGALGGAAVEVGGDRLIAWKTVPLAWTAVTLLLAWLLFRRAVGERGAWAGLLLLALPTRGLQELSLMAWGNHAESGLWVLAALLAALTGPAWLAGLLVGLGTWFCRTSLYGGVVALAMALWRAPRRAPLALTGLAIGLLPLLLPQGAEDVGTYDLAALSPPGQWAVRAAALLSPTALSVHMLPGHPTLVAAVLAAGLLGAALGIVRALRQRCVGPGLPALLLAGFLAGWTLQGTPLPPSTAGGSLVDARYLAPWFLLLPLGAAVAGPGWRRLLLLPALVAGLTSQLYLAGGSADPTRLPATDLSTWARVAAERLPLDRIPQRAHSAPAERALAHARGLSLGLDLARRGGDWVTAAADLPEAVCTGLGQGLVDHPWTEAELARAHRGLAQLDPRRAQAVGRGMALNLAFDIGRRARDLDAQLELLATGRTADAPARLAAAAARSLVGACRGPPGPCLADRLSGRDRDEAVELAWGAGAVLGGLRADPRDLDDTAAALAPVDPAVAAAFAEAALDPVVHGERAVRVEVLRRQQEAGRR